MFQLNDRAWRLAEVLASDPLRYRVTAPPNSDHPRKFIDCRVRSSSSPGGIEAGLMLARICLADLASVSIVPSPHEHWHGPAVMVQTDHPVLACLASQYAGWQLKTDKFFAMGSGPMRAVANREPLFADIGYRESSQRVVGVLETSQAPPDEVFDQIAVACQVPLENVLLLGARTASLAGSLQVVARSVETALHKLHELKFDLKQIVSGYGVAPLPPIAKDDLTAIGWTNDSVLYGAEVTLWVQAEDDELSTIGPKVPSNASADYGEPFGQIFKRYNGDFYKIDPLLFSPAVVTFVNLRTGLTHRYGALQPGVLQQWLRG